MPQFNIHWKGYPHHHLPRIRVASQNYVTAVGRRYSHLAALNISQTPYDSDLQKARLQERERSCRRKKIVRGSLDGNMVSSCSSQLTPSDIPSSVLESPRKDLARGRQNDREFEVPGFTEQLSEIPFHLSGDLDTSAEMAHNPTLTLDERDNSMSSMYITDRTEAANLENAAENKRQSETIGGLVHGKNDRDVQPGGAYKAGIYGRTPVLGKIRTYDPRLPLRRASHRKKPKSSKNNAVSRPKSTCLDLKPAAMDKEPISTDLPIQRTTNARSSSFSTKSSLQPVRPSDLPSRTPSQQLALKKFSRELERHLVAQEAVRKAYLSSSLSSSTFSAETIVDFVPYIAEFQAAGLAVTSIEQHGPAIRQSRREVGSLVTKEIRDKEQTQANIIERMYNGSPIVSRDSSDRGICTDTTSVCTTVTAPSNCREPDSVVAYPAQNIPMKKIRLPWLRKAQEPSLSVKSYHPRGLNIENRLRSSTESTCETCATTVIEFSSPPVESNRKQTGPDHSSIRLRQSDIMDIGTDHDLVKSSNKEIARPIVPKRPVHVLDRLQSDKKKSGKFTGTKKAQFRNDVVIQNNERTLPYNLTPATGMSTGSFRTLPKLLVPQKVSQVEDRENANIPTNIAVTAQNQRVPSTPSAMNHALGPDITRQLPDLSIQDQYGYETPSIFELALHGFANGSQSFQEQFMADENTVTSIVRRSSGCPSSSDPVKRKSMPYKIPKLSSQDSTAATASSLGFAATGESRTTIAADYSDIRDKDVFKGLQIALAAACDKKLDLWITETSGRRVRRFLADLRAFEGLGVNTLAEKAKRTAKTRRGEQDQKMRGHRYGYMQEHELGVVQMKLKDTERKREAMRSDDSGKRALLVAQMVRIRELRAGENTRERALAMGWRDRSVSAGC